MRQAGRRQCSVFNRQSESGRDGDGCASIIDDMPDAIALRLSSTIRRLSPLVVLSTALVLAACGGSGDQGEPSPLGVETRDVDPQTAAVMLASETVKRVNEARAVKRTCGTQEFEPAGPVKWNVDAEQAALAQSTWMQTQNVFSHHGDKDGTVAERLTDAGYAWSTAAENIAAGYPDLDAVMTGWLESPGHCVNIMNAAMLDLGLSFVAGQSGNTYRTYWTMVLARPR